MKKVILLAILMSLPSLAKAADERAKRDLNFHPVMMGIDDATGEIRQLKTDSNGVLMSVSSGTPTSTQTVTGTVTADQGAAGAAEWPVVTSSDTSTIQASQLGSWSATRTPAGCTALTVSTEAVTGVAATVAPASAARKQLMITNEGPDPIRLGPPSATTAAIGQRLLVDQAFNARGFEPFAGALDAILESGSAAKITVWQCE